MKSATQHKKYNVFVGISLQKKRLGPEDVKEIISAAEHVLNAKKINFFIADDIDRINRRIRYQNNERRIADEIHNEADWIQNNISSFCPASKLDSRFIVFSRWNDVLSRSYWDLFIRVRYQFFINPEFRQAVTEIVSGFLFNRHKESNEAKTHYACEYILHEIPIMLQGIDFAGKRYRRMIYPSPGPQPLDNVVSDLKEGKYGDFPMDSSPCHVLRLPLN